MNKNGLDTRVMALFWPMMAAIPECVLAPSTQEDGSYECIPCPPGTYRLLVSEINDLHKRSFLQKVWGERLIPGRGEIQYAITEDAREWITSKITPLRVSDLTRWVKMFPNDKEKQAELALLRRGYERW